MIGRPFEGSDVAELRAELERIRTAAAARGEAPGLHALCTEALEWLEAREELLGALRSGDRLGSW